MNQVTKFTNLRGLSGDGAAVVLLSAAWCGPCKAVAPVFKQVAGEVPVATFYYADIDVVPELAQVLDVRSVPTVAVISGGVVQRAAPCGGWRKEKFLEWVRAAVGAVR